MILGIQTTQPKGFILYFLEDQKSRQLDYPENAGDELPSAILNQVKPEELSGLILLAGKGSFSAVRSAAIIANTLALSRNLPAIFETPVNESNESVLLALARGRKRLAEGQSDFPLAPYYDREPNITKQP
mgnify:CR=1 FL=1